jgi:hypothetical protein
VQNVIGHCVVGHLHHSPNAVSPVPTLRVPYWNTENMLSWMQTSRLGFSHSDRRGPCRLAVKTVNTLTVGFFAIAVVFLIGCGLFARRIKGALGEARVGRRLRELPSEYYAVISDLLLPTSTGTSQIDHLVVSRSGIFVIETKNFSGWIHGNENSEYWTQTKYKTRTNFRNPVKQNWAHVYALKEVLSDLKSIAYHPIVVFVGTAELKNVYSKTPVVYSDQLPQTILDASGGANLTLDQVRQVARRLNEACIRDRHAKREHVRLARERTLRRRQMESAGICPKCGGSLVVRSGRYGMFYGCSGYPDCRYTRPYQAE